MLWFLQVKQIFRVWEVNRLQWFMTLRVKECGIFEDLFQFYSKRINDKAIWWITGLTDWFINHRMQAITLDSLQRIITMHRQERGKKKCWAQNLKRDKVSICAEKTFYNSFLGFFDIFLYSTFGSFMKFQSPGSQITMLNNSGESNKLALNSVSTY